MVNSEDMLLFGKGRAVGVLEIFFFLIWVVVA